MSNTNDGLLYDAHENLVKEYFHDNPNPRVNGVAIGYLPPDESPQILIFVDPSAAECERQTIEQRFQAIAPNLPHAPLWASRFVGLRVPTGASISSYDPFEYNLPPVTAGTLGAVVDVAGARYILSSNHVLAQNGRVAPQAPVVEPGPSDDPNVGTVIGAQSHFVSLLPSGPTVPGSQPNLVDCALAEVTGKINAPTSVDVFPFPFPSRTPPPPFPPRIPVTKTGRTTQTTNSTIMIFRWTGYIDFSFGTYYFQELFGTYDENQPAKPTSPAVVFAAPGDSGALAVGATAGQGVGLVTARGYVFDGSNLFKAYVILICSLDLVRGGLATLLGVPASQINFLRHV